MEQGLTWRILLGRIITDPQEKQRIARFIGVAPITLTRWASGNSSKRTGSRPRPHSASLRKLINALPQYQQLLTELVKAEFEDFEVEGPPLFTSEVKEEIPSLFYSKVLLAAATLSGAARFLTICDLILVSATQQLDPERLGVSIILVQCVPPAPGDKVRSLREQFRIGTPPWDREREERTLFLGAESLAGYAVATGTPQMIPDIRIYTGRLPIHRVEHEVSVTVTPVMRSSCVAGCLLTSSTQPAYFTQARLDLLQDYSHLAMLAFGDDEFYELQDIDLRLMPHAEIQMPFLFQFNRRVEERIREGQNRLEAEREILKKIEAELIYWYAAKTPGQE